MTTQQQLAAVMRDAKPGPNYQPKPAPQPRAADYTGRLYAALPPKRVELPKLGGCIEILYNWEDV